MEPRSIAARLGELEVERDRLEAESASIMPTPVEFHPNAASAYRDKIRSLKQTLAIAGEDSRQAAFKGIREIVEKIVIHPGRNREAARLEIYGQLAAILNLSVASAEPADATRRVLVAGIGFEPMTFRL
ncbi:hypothetical protein [Nitrobacter vulgaris]|uniref:hypothetical protein n=1 Tax=Nitrobacter vulgaris TaxID=29421 RepID=UPI00286CD583|nr:hypothetical protein [Nitrobacter vulgaris]